MGQGDQSIGQQLDCPLFATGRRLALGDRCQDRFDLLIDFWKSASPRLLVQGEAKATIHKFMPCSQYGWDAGLKSSGNLQIGLPGICEQQNVCPFDFSGTRSSLLGQFDQLCPFFVCQIDNVAFGHMPLLYWI